MKKIIPIYIILFIYMIINIIFPATNISNNYIYIINPIIILLITVLVGITTSGMKNRSRNKYSKIQDVIIILLGYVLFYYLSGLIFGFSYNGYSRSINGIITNFLSLYSIIFLEEYTRYRLINFNRSKLNITLLTIFFIIINIDLFYFINASHLDLFDYIFRAFIPVIIMNITLTYLACNVGYKPSFIYRGILEAIIIFSPIITNLNIMVLCLLYLVVSYLIYLSISNKVILENREATRRDLKKHNSASMILLFVFVLVFVLFILGVFKYKPTAVLSPSMEKEFYKGDIVIIEKIKSCDNLKKGDIIYYKKDNIYIVHRIVSINYINNRYVIRTKGDNNTDIDEWIVNESDIEGIIRGKIRYLGWPSILVSDLFN